VQDRLDGALDMSTLFSAPAAQSLGLVRTCACVAQGWQAHYLAQRERIEASGHPARWEFSKQLLFERSNHAAEVRTPCLAPGRMVYTASCHHKHRPSESS
jgi:dynein heavy chain